MINENDEFHTEFELPNLSQGLLATCSKHYHLSERWKQIIRIKKKRRKKKKLARAERWRRQRQCRLFSTRFGDRTTPERLFKFSLAMTRFAEPRFTIHVRCRFKTTKQ